MEHPRYTNEEMQARIVRLKDVKKHPIPLMFIDSVLPRHRRINNAIISDTASENPDFSPMPTQPRIFQTGMVQAPRNASSDDREAILTNKGLLRFVKTAMRMRASIELGGTQIQAVQSVQGIC